ncbi:MAG: hypothetical protein PUD20_08640 [bacterium]|nr:hypothetical protein [bacterium]
MGLGTNLLGDIKKTANQITGNIPKAIICVPDISKDKDLTVEKAIKQTDALRKDLIEEGDGQGVMSSFRSLTGRGTTKKIEDSGYLALEVQYNPSSIYLETVAGTQKNFTAGNMGDASTNQLRQNVEPVSTTMSVELLFDDVNVQDSFMISNLAPNIGNALAAGMDIVTSIRGGYSVKPQMDGIMSLLTRDYTRHIMFFWAKMCFQGELSSVSSHYTMFNTSGNPVRGTIRMTIRQSEDPAAKYENTYWKKAFSKAFGDSGMEKFTKAGNVGASFVNNSVLNLNL